ncbi:MAG: VWA-like domain-containing protein [Bacteroidaceae bacterium]|nr:VWA-like domain-containing protein [Bacteroidaceae bacterium]
MDSRIKQIIDKWYLTEPALLMTVLAHEMVLNANMSCPFRCGKGKIEYNPEQLNKLSDSQLENCLKAEAIRIILKHPYERQPDGCKRKSMALGSNLVLSDNYDFTDINLPKPSDFNLPENESYEWYSMRIEGKGLVPDENGDVEIQSTDNNSDTSKIENEKEKVNETSPNQEGNSFDDDSETDKNTDKNSKTGEDSSSSIEPNGSSASNDEEPFKGSTQSNDSDDNYFVLTLADGSIMRIPKSSSSKTNKPNQNSEADDSNADNPNIPSEQNRQGGHPKEKRIFDNQPKNKTIPSADLSSLWEEDSMMSCTIDAIIEEIESSGAGWGSLAGNLAQTIIANTKAKIDYRKTLTGFRASILSSKRHLTRMRPNRRSGFENMGSIRRFDTNILIAVDVSGSISDEVLTHFYSVIRKLFKYGVEHVDVVQFDCSLSEVQTFEKAKKRIEIVGRGGTSFQPIFDFIQKKLKYDGLIIFTDGDAPKPKKPKRFKTKVVWVCENEKAYQEHKSWMKETGRCCFVQL